MAELDFTPLEGGAIQKRLTAAHTPATALPRGPAALVEIYAALTRIAEAGAEAGTADDADWSGVYAAILDAHRRVIELS